MNPRQPRAVTGIAWMIVLAVISAAALATIGPKARVADPVSLEEVRIRWAAEPFPGEAGGGR